MIREQPYHDWDRRQWASRPGGAAPTEPTDEHWNKFEWVGDRGGAGTLLERRPEEMPEGESALSGFRHNPGVQHWGHSARRAP